MSEHNDNESPKRRWTIEIDAGGDTLDDALSVVRHFLHEVRSGSRSVITGGYSRGGQVKVTERPDVTHESYAAAVERWADRADGVASE